MLRHLLVGGQDEIVLLAQTGVFLPIVVVAEELRLERALLDVNLALPASHVIPDEVRDELLLRVVLPRPCCLPTAKPAADDHVSDDLLLAFILTPFHRDCLLAFVLHVEALPDAVALPDITCVRHPAIQRDPVNILLSLHKCRAATTRR